MQKLYIYLCLITICILVCFSIQTTNENLTPVLSKPILTPHIKKENTKKLEVIATAYTLTECSGSGITSTGTTPKEGRTIAADPNFLPYGTKLIIGGISGYVVEDTGGYIRNNRIDIYFRNYNDAINFGRKRITIELEG